jgi:hypothetical protein
VNLLVKVIVVRELVENFVDEARGHFGNREKGEHLPLEADTGGLVKTQLNRLSAMLCEIATTLELLEVQSFMSQVNPITNSNPVCSHSYT